MPASTISPIHLKAVVDGTPLAMHKDETDTRRNLALAIARSRIMSQAGSARSDCPKKSPRFLLLLTIFSNKCGSGNRGFPCLTSESTLAEELPTKAGSFPSIVSVERAFCTPCSHDWKIRNRVFLNRRSSSSNSSNCAFWARAPSSEESSFTTPPWTNENCVVLAASRPVVQSRP